MTIWTALAESNSKITFWAWRWIARLRTRMIDSISAIKGSCQWSPPSTRAGVLDRTFITTWEIISGEWLSVLIQTSTTVHWLTHELISHHTHYRSRKPNFHGPMEVKELTIPISWYSLQIFTVRACVCMYNLKSNILSIRESPLLPYDYGIDPTYEN